MGFWVEEAWGSGLDEASWVQGRSLQNLKTLKIVTLAPQSTELLYAGIALLCSEVQSSMP